MATGTSMNRTKLEIPVFDFSSLQQWYRTSTSMCCYMLLLNHLVLHRDKTNWTYLGDGLVPNGSKQIASMLGSPAQLASTFVQFTRWDLHFLEDSPNVSLVDSLVQQMTEVSFRNGADYRVFSVKQFA